MRPMVGTGRGRTGEHSLLVDLPINVLVLGDSKTNWIPPYESERESHIWVRMKYLKPDWDVRGSYPRARHRLEPGSAWKAP